MLKITNGGWARCHTCKEPVVGELQTPLLPGEVSRTYYHGGCFLKGTRFDSRNSLSAVTVVGTVKV